MVTKNTMVHSPYEDTNDKTLEIVEPMTQFYVYVTSWSNIGLSWGKIGGQKKSALFRCHEAVPRRKAGLSPNFSDPVLFSKRR